MPTFSKASEERLATCHPDLVRVAHSAIKRVDFTVLCGHRGKADQEKCFAEKRSKLCWPKSRHNSLPSEAMDLAPFPIDWNDTKRFKTLAMVVLEEAARLGVKLVWGGDFTTIVDMPHFELDR